jgi:hypothetical protein
LDGGKVARIFNVFARKHLRRVVMFGGERWWNRDNQNDGDDVIELDMELNEMFDLDHHKSETARRIRIRCFFVPRAIGGCDVGRLGIQVLSDALVVTGP